MQIGVRPQHPSLLMHGMCCSARARALQSSRQRWLHAHHHPLQPLACQQVRLLLLSQASSMPSIQSHACCPTVTAVQRLQPSSAVFPLPDTSTSQWHIAQMQLLASRSSWLEQRWADATSELIKRAVMSPDYMKAAWAQDIQNIKVCPA